jgi:hypothetical protein
MRKTRPLVNRTTLIATVSAITSGLIVAAVVASFPGMWHEAVTPVLPKTAIVAFEGPCPADWDPYRPADGRFVIGSGSLSDGTDLVHSPTGGQISVTLTRENLPRMEVVSPSRVMGASPPGNRDYQFRTLGGPEPFQIGALGAPSGKVEAIRILPPYLALNYCKRR